MRNSLEARHGRRKLARVQLSDPVSSKRENAREGTEPEAGNLGQHHARGGDMAGEQQRRNRRREPGLCERALLAALHGEREQHARGENELPVRRVQAPTRPNRKVADAAPTDHDRMFDDIGSVQRKGRRRGGLDATEAGHLEAQLGHELAGAGRPDFFGRTVGGNIGCPSTESLCQRAENRLRRILPGRGRREGELQAHP